MKTRKRKTAKRKKAVDVWEGYRYVPWDRFVKLEHEVGHLTVRMDRMEALVRNVFKLRAK